MKTRTVKICCVVLYICSSCFSIVWAIYSGAWCPYQTEKVIPCRTRNGSEPYYGPNVCWRNGNGSYSCTKKILYRPKYITTFKKVLETKYKCCPGRNGVDCENECFNCTTYKKLEDRVAVLERRLSRLEYPKPYRSDRLNRDYSINLFGSKDHDALSINYATVHSRLQTLLGEFKDLQNRIRQIENEMSRLNGQVDDLSISNNIVYDYSGVSPPSSLSNKDTPDNQESHKMDKDEKTPTPSSSTSTVSLRSKPVSQGPIRVLEENLERGDIASTLNDDYGDEIYNDNSTEQYSDQLQQLKP